MSEPPPLDRPPISPSFVHIPLAEDQPIHAEDQLNWALFLLETPLPFRLPSGSNPEDEKMLQAAHKLRSNPDFFQGLWRDPETREILLFQKAHAQRYAAALLGAVLGHAPELNKETPSLDLLATHDDDEASLDDDLIFHEPAWDPILKTAHRRLGRLFRETPPGSHLFSIIHGKSFLAALLEVMKSPDSRDGEAISTLLRILGRRILQNLRPPNPDQDSVDALTNLHGILYDALEALLTDPSNPRTRALPYLLRVVRELLEDATNTSYKEAFQALVVQRVVPLFGRPEYYIYHFSLNGFLGQVFDLARQTDLRLWDLLCAKIIKTCLPDGARHDESIEGEAQRLAFLLSLFSSGRITLSHHIPFLRALIRHVRRTSSHLIQTMVLHELASDSFIDLFSKHSPLYSSSSFRRCVFRELLVRLSRWFLKIAEAAGEGDPVRGILVRLLRQLFRTPEAVRLLRNDQKLHDLHGRVRLASGRGSRPSAVPLISMDLSSVVSPRGPSDEPQDHPTSPIAEISNSTPRRRPSRRDPNVARRPSKPQSARQRSSLRIGPPSRRGKSSSLGSLLGTEERSSSEEEAEKEPPRSARRPMQLSSLAEQLSNLSLRIWGSSPRSDGSSSSNSGGNLSSSRRSRHQSSGNRDPQKQ